MTDEPNPATQHWVVRIDLAELPPGVAYTRDGNRVWLAQALTRAEQMRCIAEALDELAFPQGPGYRQARPDLHVVINAS